MCLRSKQLLSESFSFTFKRLHGYKIDVIHCLFKFRVNSINQKDFIYLLTDQKKLSKLFQN